MNTIQVSILALACSLGIRANAATIAVTYSFTGDAGRNSGYIRHD